ncbi:hypothetical protein Sked_32950 [Sanguibacter keddieii DSM 10542]|uniref:Uncharacterized protein n=1 Tax=Sanguibacter keddieii (strain ATCC 51767 / DSM 10542 / NCFB 3025 / ST-74) TaxID=446469 RepID=D1BDW9_SANKS|nr:T3SS effector HopA1 family protein [Sanguibacter keddieii]ACZ23190.1 hypothetical protein Sked_32950 [Sanguibacter keddieii DSM 10542]
MSTTTTLLPDDLLTALGTVVVSDGGRSVTVGDADPIEGPSAAAVRTAFAGKLYEVLHTGPRSDAEDGIPRSWRDARLEQRLEEATPHQTVVRTVPLGLLPHPTGSHLVAVVDGVRFAVDRDLLVGDLPAEVRDGAVTEWTGQVRLPAVRPGLSPGFFLVDGSVGRPHGEPVLRVYLHVRSETSAPEVWRTVLTALEGEGAAYRAKIGSHAALYPRRDAMVVYLGRSSWHLVGALLRLAQTLDGIGDETSLLARRVGPGVGVAFEPADRRTGWTNLSFGEHRCHAIVDGILSQAGAEHLRGSDVPEAVASSLAEAGVVPGEPWRNVDSPDVDLSAAQPG